HRNSQYRLWRQASGIDKAHTWVAYQESQSSFRHLVRQHKRATWHKFCSDLEQDFSIALCK
ncbi:hypothetical protein H4R33_007103, partial [Dimargaris cristalligena]